MTRSYPDRDISKVVARLRQHYVDTGANYAQEAADKLELLDGEIGSDGLYIVQLRAENAALREALQAARRTMQNQWTNAPRIGMEAECAMADAALALGQPQDARPDCGWDNCRKEGKCRGHPTEGHSQCSGFLPGADPRYCLHCGIKIECHSGPIPANHDD